MLSRPAFNLADQEPCGHALGEADSQPNPPDRAAGLALLDVSHRQLPRGSLALRTVERYSGGLTPCSAATGAKAAITCR